MLDLFRYLSNDEFEVVSSIIRNKLYKKGIEDNVFALLISKQKFIGATIHSSAILWKNTFRLEIGLENALMKLEGLITSTKSFGFPEKLIIYDTSEPHFYGNPNEIIYSSGYDESWELEVDEFAHALDTSRQVENGNIHDAIEVMKLIDDIYRKGEIT